MANLLNNRRAVSAYLVTSLVAGGLLLALFQATGLAWADAGLGRAALGRGFWFGLVLGALVAVVYLVSALLPATADAYLDRRVEQVRVGAAGYQVLVRIPFGTVLLEEIAFRGVLYGLIGHLYGWFWATVVSCALFGLWHVLPALDAVQLNRVAGWVFRAHPALVVPAAVVASALAGAVLCDLRRRTGSLVPAMTLHWATNAFGYLTAALVTWRREHRAGGRSPVGDRPPGGVVSS